MKTPLKLSSLSASLRKVEAADTPPSAETDLPIDKIQVKTQVRKDFRNIEELADSIRAAGFVQPIVVHANQDGTYTLIAGERRLRAARLAGMTTVPVVIKKGLSEVELRRLQVAENIDREDLTASEEARGVIEDVIRYGVKEACKIWNRTEAWVSKRVATERYAPEVKALLEEGLCGDLEVLHALNQIHKEEGGDKEEFHTLVTAIRNGDTVSRTRARNVLARIKEWNQEAQEAALRRETLREQSGEEEGGVPPAKPAKKAKSTTADGPADLNGALYQLANLSNAVASEMGKVSTAVTASERTEAEWALWQALAVVALPVLDAAKPEQREALLQKLAQELKENAPREVWNSVVRGTLQSKGLPKRPKDWRL